MAGGGVRPSEEAAWDMDDFEIEICKVKQPPCLATVEVLHLTEVRQVFVVSKDLDREWGSVEVIPPGFQGADDGKELSIIDVIVLLCWDEQLREIGARVPVAIRVSPKKDGA